MRYLHYDVFTDRKFEGNQLAVFPDARGLSSARMQTITREMNFLESTLHPAGRSRGHRRPHEDLHARHGIADGRPSRIHMRISEDANGQITRVQVGGKAVRVGEGTIDL